MSIRIAFESERVKEESRQFKIEFGDIDDLPEKLKEGEVAINGYLTELLQQAVKQEEGQGQPVKKVKVDKSSSHLKPSVQQEQPPLKIEHPELGEPSSPN